MGCVAFIAEEIKPGEIGFDRGLSSYPNGSLLIGGLSEYALLEYRLFELGKESDLDWSGCG